MKTKSKKEKSTVEQLRDIRDSISLDIQDMTFEQLKKYIDDRLTIHPKSAWQKPAIIVSKKNPAIAKYL